MYIIALLLILFLDDKANKQLSLIEETILPLINKCSKTYYTKNMVKYNIKNIHNENKL